jgi:hypothetical protein
MYQVQKLERRRLSVILGAVGLAITCLTGVALSDLVFKQVL